MDDVVERGPDLPPPLAPIAPDAGTGNQRPAPNPYDRNNLPTGQIDTLVDPPEAGVSYRKPLGKFEAVIGDIATSWWMQTGHYLLEHRMPAVEGYSAFADKKELAGYEPFSPYFVGSRSPAHTQAIKDRIDDNLRHREAVEAAGNFWTGLAAGALDPTNLIGLTGGVGASLGKRLLLGAASNAAVAAGTQTIGHFVDPTGESVTEDLASVLYAGVFGAAFGAIGGIGRGTDVRRLAREFSDYHQRVDAQMGGQPLERPDTHAGAGASAPGTPGAAAAAPSGMIAKRVHDMRLSVDEIEAEHQLLREAGGIVTPDQAMQLADLKSRLAYLEELEQKTATPGSTAGSAVFGQFDPGEAGTPPAQPAAKPPAPSAGGPAKPTAEAALKTIAAFREAREKLVNFHFQNWMQEILDPKLRKELGEEWNRIFINKDQTYRTEYDTAKNDAAMLQYEAMFERLNDKLEAELARQAGIPLPAKPEPKITPIAETLAKFDRQRAEGNISAYAYLSSIRDPKVADAIAKEMDAIMRKKRLVSEPLLTPEQKAKVDAEYRADWEALYDKLRMVLERQGDEPVAAILQANKALYPGLSPMRPDGTHAVPPIASATYEARPTLPGGSGIAPAWGFQKLTAVTSVFGRLVSSGVRAISELAQHLGGEFNFLTLENLQEVASPTSALLRSKPWIAMAQDLSTRIDAIWLKAVTGGEGAMLGNMNLGAYAQRVKDLAGRTELGGLTREELMEAVFRAHEPDGIKIPESINGKPLNPAMVKAVQEIVPLVRDLFDRAGQEATKVGFLPSREFSRRQAIGWADRHTALNQQLRDLLAIESPTTNQLAEIIQVERALKSVSARLDRVELASMIPDEKAAAIIDDILARGQARQDKARTTLERMKEQIATQYEMRMAIYEELQRKQGETGLTPNQERYLKDLDEKINGVEEKFQELSSIARTVEPGTVDYAFTTFDQGLALVHDGQGWRDINEETKSNDGTPYKVGDHGAVPPPAPDWHAPLQGALDKLADHLNVPRIKLWLFEGGATPADAGHRAGYLGWRTHGLDRESELFIRSDSDALDAYGSALHEFGHHVDHAIFRNADPATQKALQAAHAAWLAKQPDPTLYEVRPLTSLAHKRSRDHADGRMSDLNDGSKEHEEWWAYARGFNEWKAEQIGLWLSTDAKPVSVVDKFFKSIADAYRQIMAVFKDNTGYEVATDEVIAGLLNARWRTEQPRIPAKEPMITPRGSPKQQAYIRSLEEQLDGPMLTHAQDAFVNDLRARLRRDDIEIAENPHDPRYLPRMWDREKVLADHNGARRLQSTLERWFRENPDELRGENSPKEAANSVIQSILRTDDDVIPTEAPRYFSASFAKSREVKIPNALVADFVDTNVEHLAHRYMQRAGIGIENARAFKGDTMARDAVHDAMIQGARELTGSVEQITAQLAKHENDLDYFRDSAMGRLRVGMPLTLSKVTIETAKNTASMASLGGVAGTALMEGFRTIMTRGLANTIQFTLEGLIKNLDGFKEMSRQMKLVTGEGFEAAHGMVAQQVVETNTLAGRAATPGAARLESATRGYNQFANTGFYLLNGLATVTDFLKSYVQVMSAHFMIEDMRVLVARGGGDLANDSLARNLAGYGIDAATAHRIITEMPIQQGSYLNLPNITAWGDPELVAKFAGAVAGEVRRTIVSPGPSDKSMIQQGFRQSAPGQRREWAIATLPFQFMNWGIAANQRVLLSALQGRDANAMIGMISLVGLGYVSEWMRSGPEWDNKDASEKMLAAVERSGALGGLLDFNTFLENGSQATFGVRPLFGMDPKMPNPESRGGLATPFGPVGAKMSDMARAFTDPELDMGERGSLIRRGLPLNNLFYLKGGMTALQKTITDDLLTD